MEPLCGVYVHSACKKAEIAKRALSAGGPVEIPAEGRPEDGLTVGIKSRNRRNFRRMKGGGRR